LAGFVAGGCYCAVGGGDLGVIELASDTQAAIIDDGAEAGRSVHRGDLFINGQ